MQRDMEIMQERFDESRKIKQYKIKNASILKEEPK